MRNPLFAHARLIFALAGLWGLAACSPHTFTLAPNPTPYQITYPSEYYLYLPSSYAPDRDWPLFVGIHGFSGDGTDCLRMWQDYAEEEGFVLVCPSLGEEDGGWYVNRGEADLHAILRQVQKDCRVQERFFLAGFSAGAEFAQAWAFDNPKTVSAVAVVSAGNYYEPVPKARKIPFLVIIGAQDDPLSLENARLFTSALEQAGFMVEMDILPGIGHAATSQALDRTIKFYQHVYAAIP